MAFLAFDTRFSLVEYIRQDVGDPSGYRYTRDKIV